MDKTILAIDMSAIFYMAHHATADMPLSEAKKITLETIARIRRVVPDAIPVVCCDSKSNWRKKLDPTYKANREKQPATFYAEMDRVKERLRLDGLLLYEVDGYEADDLIATICTAPTLARVIIASPDKDLLQLVRPLTELPEVRQLRTHEMYLPDGVTPKLWDENMVLEIFGVPPHRMGDYLAIVGDKADNVAGIEGVGGKGAACLIAEYGNLENLITNYESNRECPFDRKTLTKWKKYLITYFAKPDSIAALKANRVLVGLKADVPIDIAEIFKERKPLPLTQDEPDMEVEVAQYAKEPDVIPRCAKCGDNSVGCACYQVAKAGPTQAPVTAVAVAKVNPALAEFDSDLQPTGMSGLYWLCKQAINSRLYTKFESPEQAMLIVLRGRDYKLSPAAALEQLNPVKGRVCPPAALLIERAKSHPDCDYFYCSEKSATSATYVTKNKRNPQETSVTYTIDMAKKAGLFKKDGAWDMHPERMCVKMAGTFLAREEYPSSTLGFYSTEEMGDE